MRIWVGRKPNIAKKWTISQSSMKYDAE